MFEITANTLMRILENIKQNEFVKNVSVLASGTIIVQAISILLSPVLSRLYTPEDYGLLAVFASFISLLTVIGSFRYELAILIPNKKYDAGLILKLSLAITLGLSALVLLITSVFNGKLTSAFGNERLGFWLYFIAPVFLAAGTVQSFTYWFNRNKDYKSISGVRIFQSSVNSSLSVLFGFLKFNTSGLLISLILSNLSSSVYLLKKSFAGFKRCRMNFSQLKSVALKYKEFPVLNLPGALLDTVSINSVIFLLSYFFSESVTGSYSFALRLLTLPSVVVGTAIGQVLFQKISAAYNSKEKITASIVKSWKLLFWAGLLPTAVMFFFGEELFKFVFGAKWSEAGRISELLCLLTFAMFISSPTSSAMIVLRKQKILFWFNLAVFIYRPLSLLYGYLTDNFMKGIILFIVLEIIQIVFFNFILIRSSLKSDSERKNNL